MNEKRCDRKHCTLPFRHAGNCQFITGGSVSECLTEVAARGQRPEIICLCGSTRFIDYFQRANLEFTLQGKIVLSIGCDTKSDNAIKIPDNVKYMLDILHLHKIDLASRIHVINVDGYIGVSTQREIAYAISKGKGITFHDQDKGTRWMESCAHELGHLVACFVRGDVLPTLDTPLTLPG